jgi:NhaP-type Na+/H+ or K+/H+ antiporter
MYETIALIAAFIFLYSMTSGRLDRTIFSGAIIFTALGFIFGPLGLDVLELNIEREGLRLLAEMTLALVLFIDASNANLGVIKKSFRIPTSLLSIGLPLTILLGFGFGVLIFKELTLIEIAIIATILAPTDAALGKAVVTNESVPNKLREGLSFESGLNDGICVPILFIFLALVSHAGIEDDTASHAIHLVLEEVGIGAITGIILALIATWLLKRLSRYGWDSETWEQLKLIALAIGTFSFTQYLGGSGFIACFVGGLLFGWLNKGEKHKLLFAAEAGADTLTMITWLIFGAIAVGHTTDQMSWEPFVYAALSLTIIRMGPVFLSLAGTGLNVYEKLFIGWFGPRGLASIVFAVIVLNENLPGGDTIRQVVGLTIFFSVVLHGISANPLVNSLTGTLKKSK